MTFLLIVLGLLVLPNPIRLRSTRRKISALVKAPAAAAGIGVSHPVRGQAHTCHGFA